VEVSSRFGEGSVAIHVNSPSNCEWKIGSRPANPIGDQRHSPKGEMFAPESTPGIAGIEGRNMTGPSGPVRPP
jgi:hypothetical protein